MPCGSLSKLARGRAASSAITLAVFFATLATSLALFVMVPKGFFPVQDNGLITGLSEAAQDVSPTEMKRLQQMLAASSRSDPDIPPSVAIGAGGGQTPNTGRFFIALKPRDERTATAAEIIDRLRPQLARFEGAALFLQPAQDITVGGRLVARPVPVHAAGRQSRRVDPWAPRCWRS